ncbi:hypothetical protein DL764_001424 [Monosporascus ibericus]|uniref:Uncharacterized protein n=1 Tax=Monosporascus ibericus TaxID=155417 RepID=A0A4Q4TRB2_9PEZI|nr:hypothetical protein DL764_001424 [Monosporascus ibericus]
MFPSISALTVPRGFRCDREFRTPEPCAPHEGTGLPSPPPRPRLRLKRRNVSRLNAPTKQFLASVAAADVPIPSVEEPESAMMDQEMDNLPDVHVQVEDLDDMDIYEHLHSRTFSPPKTPAIDIPPTLSPAKYPDWSVDDGWDSSDMDSNSDYESSRPSTAFSTHTSASSFSRYSLASGDDCLSPEPETEEVANSDVRCEPDTVRRRKPRKAPWTKAMTAHLWSTYQLYLQDPKVTPMRLGKSCIPPHGVCLRVAREAKRTWRGSNSKSAANPTNRCSTPAAESSKPFVQWPHTCAATRGYLRELCRLKATAKAGRRRLMTRSPTPFNKAAHRRWNQRSTPARSPSIFSGNDMAMSLTLSTSETMQPHGPLAQLARSEVEPFPDLILSADYELCAPSNDEAPALNQTHLGSPFSANTYGPSSSASLAANLSLPKPLSTVGSRKSLKSPVRLTRSHSGTQKRRSVKTAEDLPRKRPSLAAVFGEEITAAAGNETDHGQHQPAQPGLSQVDYGDDPFQIAAPAALPEPVSGGCGPFFLAASAELTSSMQPPPLGSPFPGSSSSHSFPARSSAPINLDLAGLGRRFATVQQPTQRRPETPPSGSRLASRLAYLDQRLRDFRNRRRSQSPF